MKTLFEVSDSVFLKKTGEKGIIKSIVSLIGEGSNIYEVDFGNRCGLYMEKYLDRDLKDCLPEEKKESKLKLKIKDKIQNLIEDLGLVLASDENTVLLNAYRLQKYLAMRDSHEKLDIDLNDILNSSLYEELYNSDNDHIMNCLIFCEVLRSLDAKVFNVVMRDSDGYLHMNNLVLLGKEYYYFDCNLERSLFLESKRKSKFELSVFALGSASYDGYYAPFKVIDLVENSSYSLPKNIAKQDYDRKKIEKILKDL